MAEDPANREKLLPLLRFASTHDAGRRRTSVALADYVARMQPGQEQHLLRAGRQPRRGPQQPAPRAAARARVEVLLLGDRVDPWIMGQLHEFDGKSFQDAARGDLESRSSAMHRRLQRLRRQTSSHEALFGRVTAALGDAVAGVKASQRLTESPACLTRSDDDMSESMRRILAAAGRGDAPPEASHSWS